MISISTKIIVIMIFPIMEPPSSPVDPVNHHVCVAPVGDMYNQEGDPSEPEWVKTEREQFTEFRDKNKDGKMDKDETRDWILPSDYDHADAEAKHLVYESDTDKVRPPIWRSL